MAWAQLLLFLITNMPSLIKAIREIVDIFDGDAKAAKECLAGADESCKFALRRGDLSAVKRLAILRKNSGK